MDPRFAHIRDWIFDLDNCLYPASIGLFSLIDERMGAYIQRLLDCDPIEARRVLEAIGVNAHFDDLHDIHASSYRPKPDPHGYELLCERFGIDPAYALLADDMIRNLAPAKALGMTTVWVDNGSEHGSHGSDESVVDVRITEVAEWLGSILGEDE